MNVQLVVVSGKQEGQTIAINESKFLIGRAEDCHLKPRSELISRYHCTIVSEESYVAVRDLGSKNGVFVNGEKISSEQELKNGDRLTIGHLDFVVHVTVTMKASKKSKVQSVSDAVARTVELQTDAKPFDAQETLIADWLKMSDDETATMDTHTLDAAEFQKLLHKEERKAESSSDSDEKKKSRNAPASSENAAANALKNFFKGGR